jgi:hypothetical protein
MMQCVVRWLYGQCRCHHPYTHELLSLDTINISKAKMSVLKCIYPDIPSKL